MRLNPWSLPTFLLTIVCLNIWKYSTNFGLTNSVLAGMIAFGFIGWWWAK